MLKHGKMDLAQYQRYKIEKKGLQIYNAETWKNGFSTVSKIQDREKRASNL